MANTTITKEKSVTLWNADGWTNITFDAITPPAGAQFIRWKIDSGVGSQVELRSVEYNPLSRGSWYTNAAMIDCASNWNAPRFQARFTYSGGHVNATFTLTVEFGASYTPVTAGNKIGTADINQTGTSISSGTKLQASLKSGLTAGNKITAADFNSIVLGQ